MNEVKSFAETLSKLNNKFKYDINVKIFIGDNNEILYYVVLIATDKNNPSFIITLENEGECLSDIFQNMKDLIVKGGSKNG